MLNNARIATPEPDVKLRSPTYCLHDVLSRLCTARVSITLVPIFPAVRIIAHLGPTDGQLSLVCQTWIAHCLHVRMPLILQQRKSRSTCRYLLPEVVQSIPTNLSSCGDMKGTGQLTVPTVFFFSLSCFSSAVPLCSYYHRLHPSGYGFD